MNIEWKELTEFDLVASYYDTRKVGNRLIVTGYSAKVSFKGKWRVLIELTQKENLLGEAVPVQMTYRKTFESKEEAKNWANSVIELKVGEQIE